MTDPRFGEGAQPPTDFERQLLRESTNLADVWVEVGQRIGADALFALFGAVSGMILSVPRRATFVRRLVAATSDRVADSATLLAKADPAVDAWVDIGQRIGAGALFAILDLIPGQTVSVPSRAGFVRRLYVPRRDQELLTMSRTHTDAQLAAHFGLTPAGVHYARKRALRTAGGKR